jgi:hypothetical protein
MRLEILLYAVPPKFLCGSPEISMRIEILPYAHTAEDRSGKFIRKINICLTFNT